jgi:hypothetical protein
MSTGTTNPFDKCADELIVEIIHHLIKDNPIPIPLNRDILNLSLSNRRLRHIALPFLYRDIHIYSKGYLYRFFHFLIEMPHYAPLVRKFSVDLYADIMSSEYRERVDERSKGNFDLFANHALKHGIPDSLVTKVKNKRSWAVALSLLPLFTRLNVLEWGPGNDYDVVDDIQEFFPLFYSRLIPSSLRSFTRKGGLGADHYFDMATLFPVIIYSSLNEICGYRIVSRKHHAPSLVSPPGTRLQDWYGKSNVHTLKFYAANFHGEHVAELLKLPRALKTFTYVDTYNRIHNDPPSEKPFIQSLHHVSNTLESLTIHWLRNNAGYRPQTAWSFRNFHSLRKLDINYSLLIAHNPYIIADQMPRYLEVLSLFSGSICRELNHDDTEVLDCFQVVLAKKSSTCLAHLKVLSHRGWELDWGPLRDIAAGVGVKIVSPWKACKTGRMWYGGKDESIK